ncbi:unnamed protein product [Prunus armeniaca]|uniref:Uncharacterized protein n=1 Tax=Prunus armeniaca TaxID=36596 RepID=A0A6J5VR63_PRUAR|nr:unnamed protein product [Prunus armeniaca]
MMRRQDQQDQQSRVFYELSALVLNPPPISSHADSVLRSLTGGALISVFVEAAAARGDADFAGGVRLADAGDFDGSDALWIGDFLHWFHIDALGSRIGYGLLRGWNRLQPLCFGKVDSLLRVGSVITAKGDAW